MLLVEQPFNWVFKFETGCTLGSEVRIQRNSEPNSFHPDYVRTNQVMRPGDFTIKRENKTRCDHIRDFPKRRIREYKITRSNRLTN